MDSSRVCSPGNMVVDLQGLSAARIQRDLRKSLVEDLRQKTDSAAFVCNQLGIDEIPRADQLEKMIAAMPGIEDLVFEGKPAESGLDMKSWSQLHATHCTKGCTSTVIADDCYFKIVHHYLLRGFDPALKTGRSWEDLSTRQQAYVDAWTKRSGKCMSSWQNGRQKRQVYCRHQRRQNHSWLFHCYQWQEKNTCGDFCGMARHIKCVCAWI